MIFELFTEGKKQGIMLFLGIKHIQQKILPFLKNKMPKFLIFTSINLDPNPNGARKSFPDPTETGF
jgi:hypothetical protein